MPVNGINPFDASVVESIEPADEATVRDAIARAYAVRETMATMPAHERGRILNKTASLIEQHADELTDLIIKESGKPRRYARGEVNRAVETFTFSADEARRLHGETIPMDAARGGVGKMGYYVRMPVGVVGAITPFNFPLNLVAHKMAPAVAAGCPMVLKPAPATPLTALRLRELLIEAGLPEDALSVVVGDADVGRWLTTDERVAMITFTGSPPVARAISQVSGLRRTVFELGGNAATILDETANIDAAMNRLLIGSFAYSGQVCISVQRIYVHRSLYDDFREKFIAQTEQLVVGDPMDAETEIGPIVSDDAVKRVVAWLQSAEEQGATISAGGTHEGRMFRPTVLENVREDMQIMCTEAFAPIVNLVPFDDFEEALALANDSEFGLQAGVYTRDINRVLQAIERLDVGGVIINDVPTFRVDQMPYGGNKNSGLGREGPRFSVEEMTTIRMVVINPAQ
ncbi:MAG: aldehyde dehydrogenase family protein [Chloroflexota bacterium]